MKDNLSAIYTMKGEIDLLEVFEDKVTITPKGILGFKFKGLKGTKTIPFSSITAIQFKEAGFFNGYLQFTIHGGIESTGGLFSAVKDENSFMFGMKKNNAFATQIKTYIEKKVLQIQSPTDQQPLSTTSISDEIEKLLKLKDLGILSDQEFQSAKTRIIG